MPPLPRSLLEEYINEFQNTVQYVRTKLDESIGLSPSERKDRLVEGFAIKIPNEIPDRDLWAQLLQQTLEVQKLMCRTTSFLDSYGQQLSASALQLQEDQSSPVLKRYGRLVECYGCQISVYATSAEGCGCVSMPKTPEKRAELKQRVATVECERGKLEKFRDGVIQARAELEQRYRQNTSIVLLLQQQQPMTLPVPHEEILDAGLHIICKFQSIISVAGFS